MGKLLWGQGVCYAMIDTCAKNVLRFLFTHELINEWINEIMNGNVSQHDIKKMFETGID